MRSHVKALCSPSGLLWLAALVVFERDPPGSGRGAGGGPPGILDPLGSRVTHSGWTVLFLLHESPKWTWRRRGLDSCCPAENAIENTGILTKTKSFELRKRVPQTSIIKAQFKKFFFKSVGSPGLLAALGWRRYGHRFRWGWVHTGLSTGHGQHLPLLLGQFGGNSRVFDAGGHPACTQKNTRAHTHTHTPELGQWNLNVTQMPLLILNITTIV